MSKLISYTEDPCPRCHRLEEKCLFLVKVGGKTTGICSIVYLQQSNRQAARVIPHNSLLPAPDSDRGRACLVSKPPFSMQAVAHAQCAAKLPAYKASAEFGAF